MMRINGNIDLCSRNLWHPDDDGDCRHDNHDGERCYTCEPLYVCGVCGNVDEYEQYRNGWHGEIRCYMCGNENAHGDPKTRIHSDETKRTTDITPAEE